MLRRILAMVIVSGAFCVPASADWLWQDRNQSNDWERVRVGGDKITAGDYFLCDPVEDYLTFKNSLTDTDKDGFVDLTTGDVNPSGYVVFHFRERMRNARIDFDRGLLDSDIGNLPMPVIGCGASVQSAGHHYDSADPDDSDIDVVADPAMIPEPATMCVLVLGLAGMVVQRRRTASLK